MLEARSNGRWSVIRADGAIAKRVQLIEQELDVRLNVISDENERAGFSGRLSHRPYGLTRSPKLRM